MCHLHALLPYSGHLTTKALLRAQHATLNQLAKGHAGFRTLACGYGQGLAVIFAHL